MVWKGPHPIWLPPSLSHTTLSLLDFLTVFWDQAEPVGQSTREFSFLWYPHGLLFKLLCSLLQSHHSGSLPTYLILTHHPPLLLFCVLFPPPSEWKPPGGRPFLQLIMLPCLFVLLPYTQNIPRMGWPSTSISRTNELMWTPLGSWCWKKTSYAGVCSSPEEGEREARQKFKGPAFWNFLPLKSEEWSVSGETVAES
jgi:hypothetical protein